ncbi:MAG: glycosyltransferase family 39 protein [Candidatus Hydrogenedentes bacterium]|nr:glycosyltransferase family 39 protein [Candidatus Hydrogenedentota bacterium]
MARLAPRGFVWVLIGLAVAAIGFELGVRDVVTANEGQRATPPAEMLRSGDFVIPTLNGVDYLAKPPLLYWAIAAVYGLTGVVSPLTARIPGALAAAGLVLSAYLLSRRRAGEPVARWAALTLLASPYFLERARWAQLDIPLALAVFVAIALARSACDAEGARRAVAFSLGSGLALAAALMLKGPPALLFLWTGWLAHSVVAARLPGRVLRLGVYWALAALGIELALTLVRWAVPSVGSWIRAPVPLILLGIAWTAAAWRGGGVARARDTRLWLLALGTGLILAAPWAVAVLVRKGWPYVSALLFEQVFERTYTASEINSGSPLYYLIALPVLLAPWGLLLPFHFSRDQWREHASAYRYAVVMAWSSTVAFSLLAGKEYEYVLPAVPFFLIATAHHLAGIEQPDRPAWIARWTHVWLRAMVVLLAVLAAGAAVYGTIVCPRLRLAAEIWPVAVAVVAAAVILFRRRRFPLACVFAMALAAMAGGVLVRDHHDTGLRSPKGVGELAGRLGRAGYPVEATKVYPAFAFYAQHPIREQTEPETVLSRLAGDAPYFYVTQERLFEQYIAPTLGERVQVFTSPHTKRGLILIGNVPLPAVPGPPGE